MLESMFHAVLHTLAQDRSNEFVVHSVSPKKVTNLWLADVEEKLNSRETKLAKIAVVERILKGEGMEVVMSGQARDIAQGFNISERGGGLKKFDDLADSMLQGLGWWRWHVNRLEMIDEILDWEDPPKPVRTKKTASKDGVVKTRRRRLKAVETEMAAKEDETAKTLDDAEPKVTKPQSPTKAKPKAKPKAANHEKERASRKKGSERLVAPKSTKRINALKS
jgi:hypothetical protein